MFQSFHVANCRSVKHILECTPVVQTPAQLGHEFVGNIYSKAAALDPAVKNMAQVLLAAKASRAVFSDASSAAKTKRSKGSWPKTGNLFLEPIGNIGRKFFFGWHAVYVPYTTCTVKQNRSKAFDAVTCEFCDRN